MAAAGAVASIVGSAASLAGGGGGGGTQYVPDYESEYIVNKAYMDFLSDSYDQQLALVNSQYGLDADMTDLTYKMYVQQLAADKASQYDQLYNSYLQSLAESYMTESALEMQNLQNIYDIESSKVAANMEYQNTIQSIENARMGRELIQGVQQQEYELGKEGIQRDINRTIQEKQLSDQAFQVERSNINLGLDNLTTQERELLLRQEGYRDDLTSQLSGINKSRADVQAGLSSSVASIENQRQQLMNAFIGQQNQNVQALAQMKTRLASQGLGDTTGAIEQQLALDPQGQRERLSQQEMLNTQRGFAENQANTQMNYLGTQEELARRGYGRTEEATQLGMRQLGNQRQGVMNNANQLSLQQQGAELGYQDTLGDLYQGQQSFLNSFYGNQIQSQVLPEMQAQLQQRSAQQGQNLQQGSLEMSDLQRQFGYDVNKSSVGSSRALDAANFDSYYNLIGSNYDYNKASALASYWSDLASNSTNRAATVSGLGSSYSGQMSNLAASQRTSPMVSQSGSGGGFNFGGLGKTLASTIGLLSGNRGGNTSNQSNLYVTDSYGTYSSYNPSYAQDWSGASYSGILSGGF